MELHENAQNWLKTATKDISFGPDRRAVEAELREHLEDKTADMARIFHIDGEEAEAEALRRMGDPAEIGKKLAKLYKPWLGYLWDASQVLLGIMILAFAVSGYSLLLRWDVSYFVAPYLEPAGLEPERVELGGYTFRIVEAADQYEIPCITLRVSNPRFWEPVDGTGLMRHIVLTLEDGTRISVPEWINEVSATRAYHIHPAAEPEIVWGNARKPDPAVDMEAYVRNDIFYQDIMLQVWGGLEIASGERITLDMDFPAGEVRLSALFGEETGQ